MMLKNREKQEVQMEPSSGCFQGPGSGVAIPNEKRQEVPMRLWKCLVILFDLWLHKNL